MVFFCFSKTSLKVFQWQNPRISVWYSRPAVCQKTRGPALMSLQPLPAFKHKSNLKVRSAGGQCEWSENWCLKSTEDVDLNNTSYILVSKNFNSVQKFKRGKQWQRSEVTIRRKMLNKHKRMSLFELKMTYTYSLHTHCLVQYKTASVARPLAAHTALRG